MRAAGPDRVVGLRVLAWPLTGLITSAPVAAIARGGARRRRWRRLAGGRRPRASASERTPRRWFGLTSSGRRSPWRSPRAASRRSCRGLPNDHYHAFADPIVFVVVGLGVAALVRVGREPRGPSAARRRQAVASLAVAIVVALVGST